jgi:hypothetical protein
MSFDGRRSGRTGAAADGLRFTSHRGQNAAWAVVNSLGGDASQRGFLNRFQLVRYSLIGSIKRKLLI